MTSEDRGIANAAYDHSTDEISINFNNNGGGNNKLNVDSHDKREDGKMIEIHKDHEEKCIEVNVQVKTNTPIDEINDNNVASVAENKEVEMYEYENGNSRVIDKENNISTENVAVNISKLCIENSIHETNKVKIDDIDVKTDKNIEEIDKNNLEIDLIPIYKQDDINDDSINLIFTNNDKISHSLCNLNDIKSDTSLSNDILRRSLSNKYKMSPKLSIDDSNLEKMKDQPGLTRSDYSLVSCSELTNGQLWLSLPEEVKGDPAFESLKKLYESERNKENIPLTLKSSSSKPKRLPFVSSAPHLNNNVVVPEDVPKGVELSPFGTQKDDVKVKCDSGGDDQNKPKQTKMARARHYTKMTLLLGCWVFFTVIFLMYSEKEVVTRTTYVTNQTKYYILKTSEKQLKILLELSGPFLSEQSQQKINETQLMSSDVVDVRLERWRLKPGVKEFVDENDIETKEASQVWRIVLQDEIDFNVGEPRSKVLDIGTKNNNTSSVYAVQMRTNLNATIPIKMSYAENPLDVNTGVMYACALLIALYVLIIFEIINRTMAAVTVSTTALAVLSMVGGRPSLPELVSWLDVETLLLLFSMMLLVAIMAETGMFDYLAVFTFEVTKGKLWPLITLLCAITALLSTFLDNVTTVLLMTPVTIRLCEVMDLDPIPILMSMVLYSNIGGTMTPVGDPPNVIIASNKAVIQSGINFTNFTIHMSLGIVLVCVQTYCQLRFIYRDTNKLRLQVPRDIQELRHQISIWRRAADSLPHLSKDVQIVRERLERKIRKLNVQLETRLKESTKRACPKSTFQSTLDEMKDKYKIRDKVLLVKATVAIVFVVAVFFLHSIPEFNRVSLGWTALLGAILLLTLADREDLEPILHRVEWSTLLFFAALFVLMEALSKLGLIEYIGGLTESLIFKVDESSRLAAAVILLLWVSGLTSAFVDNIPLTTMMVRIVTSLGSNPNLNLPMAPLVWALAYGACLGGNGTLIGASANVVCAGVAEQYGYKFTFVQFFKIGFPIMIGHLIVASIYLLLCHCVFSWH